jgi:hypothetical protein
VIGITARRSNKPHGSGALRRRGARPEINPEFWRSEMNTNGFTNKTETAFDESVEALSDEALDQVAGGINPQPLPPRGE